MDDILRRLFSLEGKVALVTGGASGLGRMIAEALQGAGATVFIASRKADACEACAAEMNASGRSGHAIGFGADISSEQGVLALADAIRQRTERLDILVNNAGRTWGADLETFPYSAWESVLSLNLTGLFAVTQQLLPELRRAASDESPARIINLGSVAGHTVSDGAYSYGASKAAVHHLTRMLAVELAPDRITVNALAPGVFETRMTRFATSVPERRARMIEAVPMGRLGQEADIAAAIMFLCGPGGSHVTGTVLPLDGGRHIASAARE